MQLVTHLKGNETKTLSFIACIEIHDYKEIYKFSLAKITTKLKDK